MGVSVIVIRSLKKESPLPPPNSSTSARTLFAYRRWREDFSTRYVPGDRVTIVDIKDATRVLLPLTGDVESARRAIAATVARGGTTLYNGIDTTLKELAREQCAATEVRRHAIIVLFDGEDTGSLVSFDDVRAASRETNVAAISTITLKIEIPRAAGGQARVPLRLAGGVRNAYACAGDRRPRVLPCEDELANQYALGYTSKNPKRDGAFRRIVVRVPERPDVRTRTHAGYLAAQDEQVPRRSTVAPKVAVAWRAVQ